jgi:carbonic anhydrase
MFPSILSFPVRSAFCAALALASFSAATVTRAQEVGLPVYGDHQSPVNIVCKDVKPDPNPLLFRNLQNLETDLTLTLKNTAWGAWCPTCAGSVDQRWGSLKAYPDKRFAPKIIYGRDTYTLQEFHFHAPAEHLIDGQLAAMEIHFVFKKDGEKGCSPNTVLVIGARIIDGDENGELGKILSDKLPLPTNASAPYIEVKNFDISKVIGNLDNTYRYSGSLTAPSDFSACGNPPGNPNDQLASGYMPEIVSWVLLRDPIQMSKEQINIFDKLFPDGDARGPQAIKQQRVLKVFMAD